MLMRECWDNHTNVVSHWLRPAVSNMWLLSHMHLLSCSSEVSMPRLNHIAGRGAMGRAGTGAVGVISLLTASTEPEGANEADISGWPWKTICVAPPIPKIGSMMSHCHLPSVDCSSINSPIDSPCVLWFPATWKHTGLATPLLPCN